MQNAKDVTVKDLQTYITCGNTIAPSDDDDSGGKAGKPSLKNLFLWLGIGGGVLVIARMKRKKNI